MGSERLQMSSCYRMLRWLYSISCQQALGFYKERLELILALHVVHGAFYRVFRLTWAVHSAGHLSRKNGHLGSCFGSLTAKG